MLIVGLIIVAVPLHEEELVESSVSFPKLKKGNAAALPPMNCPVSGKNTCRSVILLAVEEE